MSRVLQAGNVSVRLVLGDVSQEAVDAIVNATDAELSGAGGVDQAVRAAAGASVAEEIAAWKAEHGSLGVSEAVMTRGGSSQASHIIHVVGPRWKDGYAGEFVALERAYMAPINLAIENDFKTLAFCSIATGHFGFPDDRAGYVAFNTFIRELREKSGNIQEIRFVVPTQAKYDVYAKVWDEVVRTMMG